MKLPDRWLQYSNSARIDGTQFVACKVPLRKNYNWRLPPEKCFTPDDLLQEYPKIKLIIDLTNTFKYYNGRVEFEEKGVLYKKIACKGGEIPDGAVYRETTTKFGGVSLIFAVGPGPPNGQLGVRHLPSFVPEGVHLLISTRKFSSLVDRYSNMSNRDWLIGVHCTHGVNRTGYLIVRYMIDRFGYSPKRALEEKFKWCRSALNENDPTLRKIAQEVNLAEMLLLEYLNQVSLGTTQNPAVDHMSQLVVKELEYLRKLKNSDVVNVDGSFATFKSSEGEFLVTVVPEEELQRNLYPLSCFSNIKPRFAKPVESGENLPLPSPSSESIYYDAFADLPDVQTTSPGFGGSIFGLLSYIFASTIGKMDSGDMAV